MLEPSKLPDFKLAIATPAFGNTVFLTYHASIIKLGHAAARSGLRLHHLFSGGDSLITRARNDLAARFLADQSLTHLLWIDADLGFEPETVFRLLLADRDICGGVYPLKRYAWPNEMPAGISKVDFERAYSRYPFNPVAGARVDEDGFIEVEDLPTGMMLIKRSVFARMRNAYPELAYTPDNLLGCDYEPTKGNHFGFFDCLIDNGRYLSEDFAFCRRWQHIGGEVYADAHSKLSHTGQHCYQGDFAAYLSTLD
jgi:hypothetical protein